MESGCGVLWRLCCDVRYCFVLSCAVQVAAVQRAYGTLLNEAGEALSAENCPWFEMHEDRLPQTAAMPPAAAAAVGGNSSSGSSDMDADVGGGAAETQAASSSTDPRGETMAVELQEEPGAQNGIFC
eukprot:COSAG06_NODE_1672_length_8747_cov_27.533418_6_plen_127_part_00